jgi:hypothetical protein
MAVSIVTERIDAWQAAGLIDSPTADRLRADDAARVLALDSTPAAGRSVDTPGQPDEVRRPSALASAFGPGVTIAEIFGYLGGVFLLASWVSLVGLGDSGTWTAIGLGIAAAAIGGLALLVRRRSARFGRAAGVGFFVSVDLVGCAVFLLLEDTGLGWQIAAMTGAATALGLATVYRTIHPGLLTQSAVVLGIVALAGASMGWLELQLFGESPTLEAADTPLLRPVLVAVGWAVTGLLLGLLGQAESRSERPGAAGRAALTRFAAGMTLVLGISTALFTSGPTADGGWDRLIPAVIGDAILVGVSLILLERAARRSASAFVYPAALGIIIAATDLNATYLAASSPWFALLVEGAILLGAGLIADRFRRRIRHDRPAGTADPAGPPTLAAEAGPVPPGDA